MRDGMKKQQVSGFTLVEVLVAIAIITVGFSALFDLQRQGFAALAKSGDVAKQILVEKQIVQHIALLNPAEIPKGEGNVADVNYQWQAEQLQAPVLMRDPAGLSQRKIALFAIDITMLNSNGKQSQLTLKQLGWYAQ